MRCLTQKSAVRFERLMRRLIQHPCLVGSYLGGFVLFFIVILLFTPPRTITNSLFVLVVFCSSLYMLLLAVLWAAQAAVGFLRHDWMTGVWMTFWTLAFLFLGSVMAVGTTLSLFSVVK